VISVVIATRNAASNLPRCLDSLRAQSFRDFEVIVMDGASTDGTVDVLRASSDCVTLWRSARDTGVYDAWNKALEHARGEWIAFLGADDWLADRQALERLAPVLRAAWPAHRVVYSRVRLVGASGELLEEMGEPWPKVKALFRTRPCIPQPGLMHHRSLFQDGARFDERFGLAADYELLLRELKSRDAVYVPVVTVNMGHGGLTTNPDNFYRLLRETRSALAKHGLKPPAVLWTYWTACAWLYATLRRVIGDRAIRALADLYRVATLRKPRYSNRLLASGARPGGEKPSQPG
jgi:glycosyltransferase involved in cell wall biosynthesis